MKPKYRSLHGLHLTAIALSFAGLSSYSVHAASRTWDGSSSANWATSSNWNNLPNTTDNAVFSSAGGGNTTIDLGVSGVTIAAINFTTNTSAAYTIGAGAVGSQTLTLGNSGAVSVDSVVVNDQLFNANLILGTATASNYTLTNSSTTKGLTFAGTIQGGTGGTAGAKIVAIAGLGTTTVEGVISNGGASSLSLEASSGLLILSGVNTFTGNTTIKSGVLQLANLGNSGSTTSNLGTGSTLKIGSLTSGGTLKYVGTGETSNRVIDLSGTTGGTTLNASGSGLLKFTSNFTATGAGVKTLSLTGSGAGEIAGRIINNSGSNTTALNKSGDSIWTLSGANTYTGLTDVQAGTLAYGVNNAIATGAVQVSGGILDLDTYSDSVGAVTLTSGSIAGSTGVLTGTSYAMKNGSVSAILAGSASLTKTASGTVTLSNSNTYTGITTISAGVLSVSSLANGGSTSNLGQSTNAAANLVLGGGTLQYTGGTVSMNRNFTLTTGTTSSVDVTSAETDLTLSGASTNTTGGLNKAGAGQLVITGANLHTGLTNVQAGTLAYGANNALSNGAVQVSGGVLDLKTFNDTVGAVILASGSITGSTGVLTGASYAVQSGSISAILAGAVALNKTTTGTAILSGANTYTGVTTVSAGTLRATTSDNALGAGAASLTLAGGILELANDTGLDFARNTTLSANSTVNSDVLTLGAAGVTHSLGTLTMTGQTLTIGSGSTVGSGTAGITFDAVAVNGGAVTTTFNADTGSLLTLGSVTPAGAGAKVIAFGGNGDTTVSGVLNDASGASTASVTKSGNGTLILANANLYDAATTISAGIVRAKNNTALGTTAAGSSVTGGATLELDGTAGPLTVGAEALTLNGTGILSGGSLRNIKGNNSYAGIITLGSASRINSDADTLTLDSSGSITGNFGLTLGGAGNIVLSDAFAPATVAQTLTKDGAGKLTLNSANTYTGLTTISDGILALGSSGALGITGTIAFGGGTLQYSSSNATDYSGRFATTAGQTYKIDTNGRNVTIASGLISSGATLNKSGSGTLTINGISTYTGKTTVSGGTLAIGSTGSIANTSEISLAGGNFNVSAVTSYALGNTQFLTGSGSVTGNLVVNGTLAIGASPGTISFNNNLTLGLGSASNFEFTSGSFGAGSFDLAQGGLAQTVCFGGVLNLFFKPDETFIHETTVKIFDFGHYAGNFSAVNINGLSGDSSATFDSGTGIVTVVPEPAAALLGGLGLLVLLRRRNR